jgi:phosphoribosylcarboxyaminoimidazole (NCAIR) mutase
VLALDDAALRAKLLDYRRRQTEKVLQDKPEPELSEWSDRPSEK